MNIVWTVTTVLSIVVTGFVLKLDGKESGKTSGISAYLFTGLTELMVYGILLISAQSKNSTVSIISIAAVTIIALAGGIVFNRKFIAKHLQLGVNEHKVITKMNVNYALIVTTIGLAQSIKFAIPEESWNSTPWTFANLSVFIAVFIYVFITISQSIKLIESEHTV